MKTKTKTPKAKTLSQFLVVLNQASGNRRTKTHLISKLIFHAYRFAGGICVPLDLAILIYRNHVPTKYHTYDRRYPVVHLPLTSVNVAIPKTMALDICLMEEHFPDMETIPTQGSCAIVGNGGILVGSGCGKSIDSHDFVIRANLPPMAGFETDVGYKTNLSAFNMETLVRFNAGLSERPSADMVQYRNQYLKHVRHLNNSILWYLKDLIPPLDEMYRSITKTIRNYTHSNIRFAYSWESVAIER